MNRFAAGLSQHPLATHAVGEVAGHILEQLHGERADLLVVFVSPHHLGALDDIAGALRSLLEPRVLIGMGAVGVVGGDQEIEEDSAVSVFAASCPDVQLLPARLEAIETSDGMSVLGWPDGASEAHTLVLLAEPFSFPADDFTARCDESGHAVQVVGGLASAAGPGGNRLILDDQLFHDGAVGVFVGDGLAIRAVVSQGCRPIGRPFTVTSARENEIRELGGIPAVERLARLALEADETDRSLMRRGLHVGVVVDEHHDEFSRGDFLVRTVLGADHDSGAVAIADSVGVGQTVQFHVRDADSADEDLRELLADVDASAALLFTCNGRGANFFGVADHDAATIEKLIGPVPLAGAFCAGELGPIWGRNSLHGFTASLALFGT